MNEQLFRLKSLGRNGKDFLRKSCFRQNFKLIFIIFFLQVCLSYPLFASSKKAMDVTKDKDFFFVKDNPLKVYAWVSGPITCANPKVILYVSANVSNVLYLWTGPNGFVSKLKNPVVSIAGTYKVKVTSHSGHSATETVTVTQNIKAPGATASVSETLSCTKTSVTLTGFSPTSGVTYKWTGPNNFVSTQQNPVVSVGGTYTLIVTNPVNGCTSSANVNVLQNIIIPDVTVSGGILNCTVTRVNLNASSSVSGITYSWSGPSGFTSTQQKPTVTSPGNYIITVTSPANGCTSTGSIIVEQDIVPPGVTAKSGDLGCSVATVNLNAESQSESVTYLWTGPDGFTSTLKNPEVSMVGTFKVLVTDTNNGCPSTDSTKVGTTRSAERRVGKACRSRW